MKLNPPLFSSIFPGHAYPMNTKFYEIKAAADTAEVLIYGDIGESWDGKTIAAKQFVEELGSIEARTLDVRVNSYGGSVSDGLAIYNAIKRHPASVTVSIDGMAASIASLIAMAGDTVTAAENAMIMIHAPWTATIGNANDMREMADVLDRYANSMASGYASKTGKSADDVLAMLTDGRDHWFDAAEALEFGLIDQVTDALQIAASFDLTRFNPPDKVKNMTTPTKKETPEDVKAQVLAAEQKRRQEIRDIAKPFAAHEGMAQVIDQMVDDPGVDLETARNVILAKLAEGSEPLNVPPRGGMFYEGENAHHHEFMAAATDALLIKAGLSVKDPHVGAGDVRGMSLVQISKAMLGHRGSTFVDTSNPAAVVKAAMTTSDFPLLLANVADKALMMGYENEPASHRIWTKEVELADFKPTSRVAVSEAPALEELPEMAEYKNGSLSERAESYALKTYGKMLHLSRQMIINDDLGGFTRIPSAFGASAARLEADKVYALLTGNPNMSDSTALFHADHGNLLSAAALSVDSLGVARAAMRKQTGIKGIGLLNILPRYLIVPAALETAAEQLIASLVDPAKSNDTNNLNWIRRLDLVVDPRLDVASETAWYLAASSLQIDTVEVAHLAGQRGVFTDSEEDFGNDSYRIKARLDFATQVIDWVGLAYNPGA